MVTEVLTLVNNARNRAGLTDMTASDFNSGVQREHLVLRSEFKNSYSALVRLGGEEFRKTFTITTADGTNGYSLGFDCKDLSTVQLYVQTAPNNIQPYRLLYITEDEARALYPNLGDIPEGIPTSWFISTTGTASTKTVYFINKPDGIYTILGYQQELASSLAANDNTACNEIGDDYIESKLVAIIRRSQGFDDYIEYEKEADEALKQYLAKEHHIEYNINYPLPRQLGRSTDVIYGS